MYFTIPGKPQGKARARTVFNKNMGRVMSYTPQQTKDYENLIKECAMQAEDREFFENEPLIVVITVFMPIPKNTSKKNLELISTLKLLPTKKPDIDNITKIILDALNGVVYTDDKQVVALRAYKGWSLQKPDGEINVEIESIKD